jgi:hypothetical protein
VNYILKLLLQELVNFSVAITQGKPFETRRDDQNTKVRLLPQWLAGVALVPFGLVYHLQERRLETLLQLLLNLFPNWRQGIHTWAYHLRRR